MDECSSESPLCRKFRPFIEVIKYEPEDFISTLMPHGCILLLLSYTCVHITLFFHHKDQFHLFNHKYYYKYDFSHTYLSHYILSLSFGSVLLTIIHLLLQINGRKNMRTTLFCVVCALLVFILAIKVSMCSKYLSNSQ